MPNTAGNAEEQGRAEVRALTEKAFLLVANATSPSELREGLILWLMGARIAVLESVKFPLSTSVADLLIDGLEMLEAGERPSFVMKGKARTGNRRIGLEKAQARAVAAVDLLRSPGKECLGVNCICVRLDRNG